MSTPSPVARATLYVVSCRKPDDAYKKISRLRPYKREAHLHAPKRAGTYDLLAAPFNKEDLEEEDLTPVRDQDGWPLDTDLRERGTHVPNLSRAREDIASGNRQDEVEDRIAAFLAGLGEPLVLFVHGYNVTPSEALRSGQALQRHFDQNGVGARVVVFRWPSSGHLLDYFPDQQSAGRFGSYAFVNLALSLRRVMGAAAPLHCFAHSMGSYVVTRALGTIAILQLRRFLPNAADTPVFDQVVYMQPDIDFDCLCSGYSGPAWDSPSYLEIPDGYAATELAGRVTIYCSTNDMALFASLFKNRTKRLGAYGPGLEIRMQRDQLMHEKVRQNVFVVNCDDWYLLDPNSGHSHSHFLQCPRIMEDVSGTLAGAQPDANVARRASALRWYTLDYPRPGPLAALAAFWKTAGSLAINWPMMTLVRFKKVLQRTTRVLRLAAPLVTLVVSLVSGAAWRDHPVGFGVMVASAAILAGYGLTWIFGRNAQRREDAKVSSPIA